MWIEQNGRALCPQPWLNEMSQITFKASGHNDIGVACASINDCFGENPIYTVPIFITINTVK